MQVESTAGFSPRKFGKFLLLERIGRGGMAEVFRAKTFGPSGFVKESAVKKILASLLDDEQFVNMFVDEARVTAYLNHDNIVQVLELGDIAGHLFISMEYVAGKDLLDVLARSARRGVRIPQEVVLGIAMEMLKGLGFAHRATDDKGTPLRIVHRDVSPSNILIAYDGRVKIGDFGIAKSGLQTSHTEIGTQKGKTGYMSPEQVTGSPIDARSDLFAATVILFEMLTMTRLFKAPNDLDVMLKIRDSDVEEDLDRASHLPPAISEILRKGLAKEPSDRFQDAEDYVAAIEEVCDALDLNPSARRVASFIQDLFADKLESEVALRRADPVTDVGFAEVSERKGPRFRYRDADGIIHGPMSLEMLEELLGSRVPEALERVSIDGAEWVEIEERPEVSGIARPGAEGAPSEPQAQEADPALRARQRGTTYDWEDLSFAGINPKRRKKKDEDGSDTQRRRAKAVSTGEYRISRRASGEQQSDDVVATSFSSSQRAETPAGEVAYRKREDAPDSLSGSFVAVSSRPRVRALQATPAQIVAVRQQVADDAGAPDAEGATGTSSVLRVLFRVLRGGKSGRLRLEARDARRDLYFIGGRCVAIDSSVEADQLGSILIAREVLSEEEVARALEHASDTRVALGEALVALRIIAPHELFHYLQEQLCQKLGDSVFWTDVIWGWWDDQDFPRDTLPLSVNEKHTLVTAVQERGRSAFFRRFFAPSLDRRLVRTEAPEDMENLVLSAKSLRVAHYLDDGLTLREVIDRFTHRYRWTTREIYQTLFLLTEFEIFEVEGLEISALP